MNDPFRHWERSLRPERSVSASAIGGLVVLFGLACLNGWLLMLAIGILSAQSVLPSTLPFWDSTVVASLLLGMFVLPTALVKSSG